jgi:hypothetical protein
MAVLRRGHRSIGCTVESYRKSRVFTLMLSENGSAAMSSHRRCPSLGAFAEVDGFGSHLIADRADRVDRAIFDAAAPLSPSCVRHRGKRIRHAFDSDLDHIGTGRRRRCRVQGCWNEAQLFTMRNCGPGRGQCGRARQIIVGEGRAGGLWRSLRSKRRSALCPQPMSRPSDCIIYGVKSPRLAGQDIFGK